MERLQHSSTENTSSASRVEILAKNARERSHYFFDELMDAFQTNGYEKLPPDQIEAVMNKNNLVCRSESFTKVMDLIDRDIPISIQGTSNEANMCHMDYGAGMRIAFLEGFSGKDVAGTVKTVIVFRREALSDIQPLSPDHTIHSTKPETSRISFAGSGTIIPEDIEMIGVRIPKKFVPHEYLDEENVPDDSLFVIEYFAPRNNRKEKPAIH